MYKLATYQAGDRGNKVGGDRQGHVSETFRSSLRLYRMSDGLERGGQDLEKATGGVVTRSYVSNLKNSRIENPGLAKLEAIAGAMDFPPQLGDEGRERAADAALAALLEDETSHELLGELLRVGTRDRWLLLGIARQIPSSGEGGTGVAPKGGAVQDPVRTILGCRGRPGGAAV